MTAGSLGEVLVDPSAAGADADMAERILDGCAGQGLEAFPESEGGEEGVTSEVSLAGGVVGAQRAASRQSVEMSNCLIV